MQEPIYCQACRFFLDAQRPQERRCVHPLSRLVVATPVGVLQRWQTPAARNPANHCRDFRPWRVWERLLMLDPASLVGLGLLGGVLTVAGFTRAGR